MRGQGIVTAEEKTVEIPRAVRELKGLKGLPGGKRLCIYAIEGKVSYRLCTRGYECGRCAFEQAIIGA